MPRKVSSLTMSVTLWQQSTDLLTSSMKHQVTNCILSQSGFLDTTSSLLYSSGLTCVVDMQLTNVQVGDAHLVKVDWNLWVMTSGYWKFATKNGVVPKVVGRWKDLSGQCVCVLLIQKISILLKYTVIHFLSAIFYLMYMQQQLQRFGT